MTDYVTMPDGSKAKIVVAYSMTEYTDLYNAVIELLKKDGTWDALENLLANEQKLPAFVHDYMRAKFHVSHDDYVAALPFIENALERLEAQDISPAIIVPQDHLIMRDVYGMAGEVFANCGKVKEAKRAYEDYQLVICRIHSDDSYEDSLLTFRNYSVFTLQDLINGTLTVCRPTKLNDPYDTLLLKWGEIVRQNKSQKPHASLLCDSFNAYRIRSFCKLKDKNGRSAVTNVLMWSHYADEHRGFCIEYKFNKKFFVTEDRRTVRFKDIQYHKHEDPINLNTGSINTNEALCSKLDDWAYENEARLITYMPDEQGDFVPISLGSEVQIKAVYFGYLCPDIRVQTIKTILSGNPDIQYFKMNSTPEDIYHLTANPI